MIDVSNIVSHIHGASILGLAFGYSAIGVGGLIGGSLALPAVSRRLLPAYRETHLWQFLKFDSVLNDESTLRLSDGSLVVTIAVAGKCEGGLDKGERRELFARRKTLFDRFAKELPEIGIRVVSRRERTRLNLRSDSGHPVRDEILARWNRQFDAAFVNRHYVILTIKGETEAARNTLEKGVERTLALLSKFGVRRLSHGDGKHSELLTFWARMINPANPHPVGKRGRDQLAKRLCGGPVDIDLDTGLLRFSAGGNRVVFGYIVVVPTWGEESAEELVARILSVPGEVTVLHRAQPCSPATAELRVGKRGDWAKSTTFSSSVAEQFTLAENLLTEGAQNAQALVDYEMIVLALGSSPEEAMETATSVEAKFVDVGARPMIDVDTAQPLYFGMFPGFDDTVRDCALFSQNVAEFITFDTVPVGLRRTNWGEGAALVVKTDQGTPYNCNFQTDDGAEAPGHFVIIGNIGGGKTVLATLLATGASCYKDLRTFAFDADRGMLTWTLFTGGRYIGLHSDIPGCSTASLQPLQLELNDANRLHIRAFLRLLTGLSDPASEGYYGDAVTALESLQPADRKLETVIAASFDRNSEAYARIYKWIDPAQYGAVFNARGENMPIDDPSCRHFVFDMTALLKDEILAPAIVFEVMHRIDATAQKLSCPVMVLIDEAAFMLRNRHFREEFLSWVARMRKRRVVVGIILQRPDQLDDIDDTLSSAVRQLMPTWFILPNPNADLSKYDGWPLTDREKHFIKGRLSQTAHLKYPVLVKKGTVAESVFIETANHVLGDYRHIFRSGEQFWKLALHCLRSNPDNPLDQYLDEAERLARAENA